MPSYAALGSLSRIIDDLPWPIDFFSIDDLPGFLDKIFVLEHNLTTTPTGFKGFVWLGIEKVLAINIPGLEGVSIVAGNAKGDVTFLTLHLDIGDANTIKLVNPELSLRYEGSLLTPVPTEEDPNPEAVRLTLGGSITIDDAFNVDFEGFDSVDLSPAMIGKTGIIISAQDVRVDVSRTKTSQVIRDAGFDDGFLGVFIGTATVDLPPGLPPLLPAHSVLTNCAIGSGGVSGRLEAHYTPQYDNVEKIFTGNGSGTLFGVPFGIKDVVFDLKRGTLRESSITGQMLLPFFEEVVDVDVALRLDGSFGVALRSTSPEGLLTLHKPGLLSLELDSMGFTVDDGKLTVMVSGSITPEVGGLAWPAFRVDELAIDSEGNVHLDGGWLDLPDQYGLDFHNFQMEITKLGMGKTEDGKGKWLGFSGGIKLGEGLSQGASVEGLRVTWYETGRPIVTFEGIGVKFEIPGTLRFEGNVDYKEFPDGSHRFDGTLTLGLLALDMEVDGTLVFGSVAGSPGQIYGALYLSTEFPTGIPLLSTGVALYGLAGLLAVGMEPDKAADEDWYRIGGNDWYHRSPVGVENVAQKWEPRAGSFALGAGCTLGTASDNGYAFAGRFLFVIVLPGPILLLQGAANLLKDRAKLSEEPQFRALAVLDGRAGTFLVGLDARYAYNASGALVDVRGSAEAFFSFHDPSLWHLYLGERTPQDRRIRAKLAKGIFPSANAYFMLDARQLALGAWIGFDQRWTFKPVSLSIEAWIEGDVLVSFRPTHFYGSLCMHGSVEIKVFRFGASLSLDACLSADVFDPFHLKGTLNVTLDLPRPFDDLSVDVSLEWGPEAVSVPAALAGPNPLIPLPRPLKEIAAEHFKVTTSWPLPIMPSGQLPAEIPEVPLDVRPHLTFASNTNDDAQVGVNGQAVVPEWEPIGDPTKPGLSPITVRYALEEIVLSKRVGLAWTAVARKGLTANPPGIPELFGSWAPVPALPDGDGGHVGQTKLWLWSKTAFDYTRHTGGAWDDGFLGRFTDYPHCEPAPDRVLCGTFEAVTPAQLIAPPLALAAVPGLAIGWLAPPEQKTVAAVQGLTAALCFPAKVLDPLGGGAPNRVTLALPTGTKRVTLVVGDDPEQCVDFTGRPVTGSLANPYPENGVTFLARSGGALAPQNAIVLASTNTGLVSGLECQSEMEITLPQASSFVDLSITCATPPVTVEAYAPDGHRVGTIRLTSAQHQTTARFTRGPITRVLIRSGGTSGTALHHVCFEGTTPSQVQAVAHGIHGAIYGPFSVLNHVVETGVLTQDLAELVLTSPTPTCLLQVCVVIPPDPAALTPAQKATLRLEDQRARWAETAPILEPHTVYRLEITTRRHAQGQNGILATGADNRTFNDYAYFETDGPPALANLSIPSGTGNPDEVVKRGSRGRPIPGVLGSALDTLALYVAQTIPPTVPGLGEKQLLPRPVYRAYDVGVQFNEDYVDAMYRLARRDLGLYLYDRNNLPVRDAEGRLVVFANRWGHGETLELEAGELRWITVFNDSDCLRKIETTTIPKDVRLTSAAEGLVLDPDTVYEGRLVPLLVHEDFADVPVGATANNLEVPGWVVHDDDGPSAWVVGEDGEPPSRFILQTSAAGGVSPAGNDPVKPGTMLLRAADPTLRDTDPAQPANWSDYRLTVTLRTGAAGAIGVVVRAKDPHHYYRLSIDPALRYRRLVRVGNAASPDVHTILAEDAVTLDNGRDAVVSIEAVGPSLRVYQDGALVFDVVDDTFSTGGIGLYAWQNPAARFSDVRVDDFGATAAMEPMELHEGFEDDAVGASANNGQVEGWVVQDDTTLSAWVVGQDGLPPSRFILQTSSAGGGSPAGNDPVKPGTMLLRAADPLLPTTDPAQPANWGDYRVTVVLRTGATGAIGMVVRMKDPQRYYRFSIDPALNYRRLVRVGNTASPGVHAVLAEDAVTIVPGQDTVIVIEAVGPSLRVYQNGALVFDVLDATFPTGGIGLYAWKNPAARFNDVLVEEFTAVPPIAYRFAFTTSKFATFADHMHSYEDEVWPAPGAPFTVNPVVAAAPHAALMLAPVTEAESRAYETLAAAVLLDAARQDPARVEVTRVEFNSQLRALLVTSPEPVEWKRTLLAVRRSTAPASLAVARVPGALKLTGTTFSALQPAQESVSLMVRSEIDPSGSRVEALLPPGPLEDPAGVQILLRDDFDGPASGLLFLETFGPNALDHYTIADQVGGTAPSAWSATATEIVQAKNAGASGRSFAAPRTAERPDVRVIARVRSEGNAAFGVAVRYQDPKNYYACLLDTGTGTGLLAIRRFIDGASFPLFEDPFPLATGRDYEIAIDVSGDRLLFWLDHALVAVVQDTKLASGRVALVSDLATGAHFSALSVEALEAPALLYRSVFEDTPEIEPVFVTEEIEEPFAWTPSTGVLTQTSPIADPTTPDQAATFAVLVSEAWTDGEICVRLRTSVAGFLGVAFRWTDVRNAYRFALNGQTGQASLLKVVAGTIVTRWSGPVAFALDQTSEVTLRAEGPRLTGFLDGVELFAITDTTHPSGRVALFCGGNSDARFSRVVVADRVRRVGGWTVVDEGGQDAPSSWQLRQGALRQTSTISDATDPAAGTLAVRGDATWTDTRVSTRMSTAEAHPLGIVFRYRDRDNYYRLAVDAGTNARALVKKTGGVTTTLWPVPAQPGSSPVAAPFTLTVDAIGSRIVGYQDGVRLFEVTDSDHAAGAVGHYCSANPGVAFESAEVRRPPQEAYALLADRFAANDTTGWTFLPSQTEAVAGDSTWTDIVLVARVQLLPFDDLGLIVRYDPNTGNHYRFAISSLPPARRLIKVQGGLTAELWSDTGAHVVGRRYELAMLVAGGTLRCFVDGVPVCVIEDASPIAMGQIGLFSSTGDFSIRFAGVTAFGIDRVFADWLLDEPFDAVVPGRWSIEDTGDENGPSQWSITGGAFAETSGITGGAPGDAARPGTLALAGESSWSDYRASVLLVSSTAGDIGVVFRYQDSENYYLLSLSLDADLVTGRRRLIAVSVGEVTVLAEDQVPYTRNREVLVTVDCVGTALRVYVDGMRVFTAIDAAVPSGRVGLYASANPGAKFAEVRVAPYQWLSYYEFAGEERLPAGQQIRLCSANAAAAPPSSPGVISRFAAFNGERGRVRFPTGGVDLRVVTPQNVAEHTRGFLPAPYLPVNMRVLRSADGTGFALIAPGGAVIQNGAFRLEWTYRRDNRSFVPGSLVLTQAGDSTAERAVLDIPRVEPESIAPPS